MSLVRLLLPSRRQPHSCKSPKFMTFEDSFLYLIPLSTFSVYSKSKDVLRPKQDTYAYLLRLFRFSLGYLCRSRKKNRITKITYGTSEAYGDENVRRNVLLEKQRESFGQFLHLQRLIYLHDRNYLKLSLFRWTRFFLLRFQILINTFCFKLTCWRLKAFSRENFSSN